MGMDPVLATKVFNEDGRTKKITVHGGLSMHKGNRAPYFSITGDIDVKTVNGGWKEESGGCIHGEIRKHFPEKFDDLIALHLSDIDGLPMHAVENGWYWLAGAVPGNFGERFHGGNSKMQHWKDNGEFDGYREPTPEECVKILAKHLRISFDEARKLTEIRIESVDDEIHVGMSVEEIHDVEKLAKLKAKKQFQDFVESQKERFAAEAKACIEKHGLKVYGDPWKEKRA